MKDILGRPGGFYFCNPETRLYFLLYIFHVLSYLFFFILVQHLISNKDINLRVRGVSEEARELDVRVSGVSVKQEEIGVSVRGVSEEVRELDVRVSGVSVKQEDIGVSVQGVSCYYCV